MDLLRSIGGGTRDFFSNVGSALNQPPVAGQAPTTLGLLAQQPGNILRDIIQLPESFLSYGLERFREPGAANTLRNLQSAGALSELLAGRPGAIQIPRVAGLAGVPPNLQIPEEGMLTPQEQYQRQQAAELVRRGKFVEQLMQGGLGGGGRLRTYRINPFTGNVQFEYTTEPYVRPEGQTPTPVTPKLGGAGEGYGRGQPPREPQQALPPPREPVRERPPRKVGQLPYYLDPKQQYSMRDEQGNETPLTLNKDRQSLTDPQGNIYDWDRDRGAIVPRRPQAPAAEPSTKEGRRKELLSRVDGGHLTYDEANQQFQTEFGEPITPNKLAEPPPATTTTTTTTLPAPPPTTPTTRPTPTTVTPPTTTPPTTTPTTLPAIRMDTTREDLLKRPFQGAGGAPGTPPAPGQPAAPGAPAGGAGGAPALPSAKTPEELRADDAESVLGIPPAEPTPAYPSPAFQEPGAAAGQAVGQAFALSPAPRIPGAGETQVQAAGLPARTLQAVSGAVRRLGPSAAAAAEAPPAEGGPPAEVKQAVPGGEFLGDFGDAVDHYRPLRNYIERHPELRTTQDFANDVHVQGMTRDWKSLRGIMEAKIKKAGEVGAADRRVLNAINGVLQVFDGFDTPEAAFGGKRAIDYLTADPTRIGIANIARTIPGLGRTLDEILSPGKTGIPGPVGQRVLPGADITRLMPTPEGRALQRLQTRQKGFLAQLARGSSEVGNLNTFEQTNMRDAFIPSADVDTTASAEQKLAEGRAIFRAFKRALETGQMTGEQIMRIFTAGLEADFDDLRRRGQEGQNRIAVPGPIGGGEAAPPPQ
jgi:hypothetical protein